MAKYKNGFEYLEQLKSKEPQKKLDFNSIKGYLSHKAVQKGIPSSGVFELTPLCNFDCKMCYTHLHKDQMRGKELLTVDQWKALMHSAWKAGMMYAILTGGECLSYPGFRELYLYLQSLGVLVTVLTNGALLDENWIRFFQEHKPDHIMITLYGSDEEIYERVTGQRKFATVSKNIRELIAADIPLKITVTPSKYMGEGVFDTIRMAASFGVLYEVNTMLFEPHEETGRSDQMHDLDLDSYVQVLRLLNELRGIETCEIDPETLPQPGGSCHECTKYGLPCSAGRSFFTIQWDGRMVPCSCIPEICAYPITEGFQLAWNNVRELCLQRPQTPECKDCPYLPVCIRCPGIQARFAQPGKQPLELCELIRYLVQRGGYIVPNCDW